MFDPPQTLPLAKLINLLADLKEKRDATACSTWVLEPVVKVVGAFQHSLKEFPPIPAGMPDPYVPPK